ncbi:hypothetical protein [Komagataeibacter phage phiKX1]|nr:hypothetical protein [Komagataeibacter phage phiKX1]BCZ76147.1 hypothetical protein [Komagataeibacter phage phiKX2]
MPFYKNGNYFTKKENDEFSTPHNVNTDAPLSGIYRCTLCGHEIVIDKGRNLPPDGDHKLGEKIKKHTDDEAKSKPLGFKWELVAAPKHYSGTVNKIQ